MGSVPIFAILVESHTNSTAGQFMRIVHAIVEVEGKKTGVNEPLNLIAIAKSWYECIYRVQYNSIYTIRNRNSFRLRKKLV